MSDRRWLLDRCNELENKNKALKEKLAKATEALEFVSKTKSIVYTADPYNNMRFELAFYDFKRQADETLAEIKGDK